MPLGSFCTGSIKTGGLTFHIEFVPGYASFPETDHSFPDRIENSGDYHRENLANFVEQPPGGSTHYN